MSPRQRALNMYITTVLGTYPDAKYRLWDGLWYVVSDNKLISYGQKTPYEAWKNAAGIIFTRQDNANQLPKSTT